MKKLKLFNNKSMSTVAFFNILGPIILNGVNFFTIPIFSRMLGTGNYGMYSLYTTWVSIFTIILGLQTYGTIATACAHYNDEKQKEYLSSITTLSFCSFAVFSIISFIFLKLITEVVGMNKFIVMLILLHSFFGFCISIATTYFTFKKDAYKTFVISVITAIIGISLSFIFISKINDAKINYMGRIAGSAIPTIVIGLILMIYLLVKGRVFFSKKYWRFCLPLCLPLIFHGLSGVILSQSDRIMLKGLTGSSSVVGIYSLVYVLSSILNIIWIALNNTWLPFYYNYLNQGDTEKIVAKSKSYLKLYTSLTIGFIMLSPEIAKLCSSKEYWTGIKVLPILASAMFVIFLYSFPVNFEFYYRKSIHIAVGTTLAAIFNIILNYVLIPHYGMIGAAVATLLSYILLFGFHQFICANMIEHKYHYSLRLFIPYCFAVAFACILFYLFENFWIPRWMVGILLGVYLVRNIIKNKSIL